MHFTWLQCLLTHYLGWNYPRLFWRRSLGKILCLPLCSHDSFVLYPGNPDWNYIIFRSSKLELWVIFLICLPTIFMPMEYYYAYVLPCPHVTYCKEHYLNLAYSRERHRDVLGDPQWREPFPQCLALIPIAKYPDLVHTQGLSWEP